MEIFLQVLLFAFCAGLAVCAFLAPFFIFAWVVDKVSKPNTEGE